MPQSNTDQLLFLQIMVEAVQQSLPFLPSNVQHVAETRPGTNMLTLVGHAVHCRTGGYCHSRSAARQARRNRGGALGCKRSHSGFGSATQRRGRDYNVCVISRAFRLKVFNSDRAQAWARMVEIISRSIRDSDVWLLEVGKYVRSLVFDWEMDVRTLAFNIKTFH